MQRVPVAPRDDWKDTAIQHGFDFHSIDGDPYCDRGDQDIHHVDGDPNNRHNPHHEDDGAEVGNHSDEAKFDALELEHQ